MRTSPLLSLCLLLVPSLLGCKRADGDTVVEGTVIDRHTTVRIAHATVVLYRPGGGLGGSLGGGYVEYGRYQADASGNFSFRLDGDRDDLLLRAFSDLGAYTIWQEGIHLRGGRNNKDLQLKVQSPAWVRVQMTDDIPRDTGNIGFPSFSTTNVIRLLLAADTSFVVPIPGNQTTKVFWTINRIHVGETQYSKDMYCPALDTIPLDIRY